LTRLLRDDVKVIPIEEASPAVQAAVSKMPPWPHPESVAVIDGLAVVALGRPQHVQATER